MPERGSHPDGVGAEPFQRDPYNLAEFANRLQPAYEPVEDVKKAEVEAHAAKSLLDSAVASERQARSESEAAYRVTADTYERDTRAASGSVLAGVDRVRRQTEQRADGHDRTAQISMRDAEVQRRSADDVMHVASVNYDNGEPDEPIDMYAARNRWRHHADGKMVGVRRRQLEKKVAATDGLKPFRSPVQWAWRQWDKLELGVIRRMQK